MTVSAHNLTFGYDKERILEDANMTINPGEFIGIFGPNGGGKTTLLKLLLGLLSPQGGKVELLGRPPSEVRDQVGYVPQVKRFDRQFPITALEVVLQGLLSQAGFCYGKELRKKAHAALDRVSLSHKASASFGTLSGGETQRVLIARSLVSDPKILFLDEATAGVDAAAQEEIYQLLIGLKKTLTIVFVTHDLQAIVSHADLLYCVNRSITAYSPSQVCSHFALGLYHPPLPENDSDG
ncbi:MAG: Zinc import ATP-binding protein ZnuC [Chlamydiae bacterium]|nr:Zinc import ATP-binding protein ZnuC [Chlamydiota bacterium]